MDTESDRRFSYPVDEADAAYASSTTPTGKRSVRPSSNKIMRMTCLIGAAALGLFIWQQQAQGLLSEQPSVPSAARAVFPATPPRQLEQHKYGFQSEQQIAERLNEGTEDPSSQAGAEASSQVAESPSSAVTVTAVVLPVRTLVLDSSGSAFQLLSNTDGAFEDSLWMCQDSLGKTATCPDAVWADLAGVNLPSEAGEFVL